MGRQGRIMKMKFLSAHGILHGEYADADYGLPRRRLPHRADHAILASHFVQRIRLTTTFFRVA